MAVTQIKNVDGVTKDIYDARLTSLTATVTELNYCDGVTSNIQTQLDAKEATSNKVTSVSSSSTDTQYPSAKALYDVQQNLMEVASGKTASYVVSDATNPLFNSQANTINLTGTFTDVDGTTHNITDLKLGDTIYVSETDVPDRWSSDVKYVAPISDTNGSTTQSGTPTPTSPISLVSSTFQDADGNDVVLRSVGTYIDTYTASNTLITRNTDAIVLDGTESWYTYNNRYSLNNHNYEGRPMICTHFVYQSGKYWNDITSGQFCHRFATYGNISFYYDGVSDLASWTAWLAAQYAAGTPVIIYCALGTATTETKPLYQTSASGLVVLYKLETAKVPITSISKNGTVITPVNSNVNIIVPTSLTDFNVTATAAELNTLDGITATTAELNMLSGRSIDSAPTSASTNLVTSGGVYTAVSGKEDTANKVTSLTASSTDTQYPSAKCVYDLVGNIETLLADI